MFLKKNLILISLLATVMSNISFASLANQTQRIPQLSNKKVTVWQTLIYPHESQKLPMHRHDNDRVLVALTNGVLKITTDKGETKLMHLTKGESYYLPAETAGVLHTDENIGNHIIKVIVINLN